MVDSVDARRVESDRAPGWHPDHINPNLQRYWDGSEWTAVRRWVAGKWIDEAQPVPAHTGTSNPAGHQHTAATARQTGFIAADQSRPTTVTPGVAGLLICSFLLILGSFTPWVTISLRGHSLGSVAGTDPGVSQLIGVNGWITFSAGLLLFVLMCMIAVSGAPLFRSVALFVALAAAGFAIYDLIRILQKISQAASADQSGIGLALQTDNRIGWGLVVVVVGGVGALICALSLRNDR